MLRSDGLRARWSRAFMVAGALAGSPVAADAQADSQELKKLSIEELMNIDVTLTARRPEPVGAAAAAISVITRDDIRRAGVTTIADAVALADGVHVARFNNGTWAITARGFNQNTANKLLVMVDGRTVYSPLFAGVFWNTIDYVLDDIDRIEVIRGPGATLWGANAVNGVVNIVTRSARETQGTLVSFTSGNEDPAVVEIRRGGGGGDLHWRAYGKFARRDDQKFANGASAGDAVNRGQAGFRIDGGAAGGDTWFVKGDFFHSRVGFADRPDGEFTDANLQARLARAFSDTSRLDVGGYYRREYRRVPAQLTHHIDTVDVDLQHAWTGHSRHQLVWGGAVLVNVDETHGSAVLRFEPARRTYSVSSLFVQDEFALSANRIFVTGGVKIEHNAFSGADWQPNIRARWMLPRRQVLWGAVARAVRRPTRFDDDIVATAPNGLELARGSDDFVSEKLTSFEIGYRTMPGPVSVDGTVFAHRYNDLRSQESAPAAPLPIRLGNTLRGRSAGVELGVNIQPLTRWRTHASYTYLDTEITRAANSRDVGQGLSEANDPHHLFSLRTSVDVGPAVELDGFVRYAGALPNPAVPSFTEVNARVSWRLTPQLAVALVGQDLAHARHPEFGPDTPLRLEFERSVRAVVTLRFP